MSSDQTDLFAPQNLNKKNSFPEFEIERPEVVISQQPNHAEMREMLAHLGFDVGELCYRIAPVISPFPSTIDRAPCHVFIAQFPDGWKLSENQTRAHYYADFDPIYHLLDPVRRLRGMVFCDSEDIPRKARLYTRYTILEGSYTDPLNVVDFDKSAVRTIVVDRSLVDPAQPRQVSANAVVFEDRRDLLVERSGVGREAIRVMEMSEFMVFHDKHISHGESGSSLWLDEHYPDWRNPVSYW